MPTRRCTRMSTSPPPLITPTVSVTEKSEGPDIIEAHSGRSNHREAVLAAERCGRFNCCAEFEPGAITDWVDPA